MISTPSGLTLSVVPAKAGIQMKCHHLLRSCGFLNSKPINCMALYMLPAGLTGKRIAFISAENCNTGWCAVFGVCSFFSARHHHRNSNNNTDSNSSCPCRFVCR
jgi:hypothetical protein